MCSLHRASNRNTLERTDPARSLTRSRRAESTQNETIVLERARVTKVILRARSTRGRAAGSSRPDKHVSAQIPLKNGNEKPRWNGRRSLFDHLEIFAHSLMNSCRTQGARGEARSVLSHAGGGRRRRYPVAGWRKTGVRRRGAVVGTMPDGLEIEERDMEGYWLTMYGRPRVGTARVMRPETRRQPGYRARGDRRPAAANDDDDDEDDDDRARVFIDIGADLGYYALAAASREDTVYAYSGTRRFWIIFASIACEVRRSNLGVQGCRRPDARRAIRRVR